MNLRLLALKYKAALLVSTTTERPLDPMVRPGEIRLLPIQSEADRQQRLEKARKWCLAHVDHSGGDRWSYRVEKRVVDGRYVVTPVYWFSDPDDRFFFGLVFCGI